MCNTSAQPTPPPQKIQNSPASAPQTITPAPSILESSQEFSEISQEISENSEKSQNCSAHQTAECECAPSMSDDSLAMHSTNHSASHFDSSPHRKDRRDVARCLREKIERAVARALARRNQSQSKIVADSESASVSATDPEHASSSHSSHVATGDIGQGDRDQISQAPEIPENSQEISANSGDSQEISENLRISQNRSEIMNPIEQPAIEANSSNPFDAESEPPTLVVTVWPIQ